MNPLLRQDTGFATLAGLVCIAAGIKGRDTNAIMTPDDFNVWGREEKPDLTVDDFMRVLGSSS